LNVKRQFVSRFDDGVLLNVDYGQMEVRVAAMLSKDHKLNEAIKEEDVHLATASMMMRKPKDQITEDERQHAKTVGFATMYGAGANTIGKHLGIHKDDAKSLINMYFRAYPELKSYITRIHKQVERDLFVETPFQFKRKFAPPTFGNWNKWDGFRVKRQAFNTLIQSTAAFILYVAMVDIDMRLQAEGLQSLMIATVHDSVLFDCPPGELERVQEVVRECMMNPGTEVYGVEVTVPLAVDMAVGKNWGEMEEVVDK
jgi:DNA polymerase-1